MEEEHGRQDHRIAQMKSKYQIGNANKGGAAFNILNLEYEKSKEGEYLMQRDEAAFCRKQLRSNNIDTLGNNDLNLINGSQRMRVQIPQHAVYNPPGSSGSTLSKVG